VQPAIVAEVESELRWNRRFQHRFEPALDKALGNSTLVAADSGLIASIVPSPPGASIALWAQIQSEGRSMARRADRGEAYTLATAVLLNVPAASNDLSALRVLAAYGHQLPNPVLRFFDLVVFAVQAGHFSMGEAEKIRQSLMREGEHIPKIFQHSSINDALPKFAPRLIDSSKSAIGRPPSADPAFPFTDPIVLSPK
jgi:hypothetical protein